MARLRKFDTDQIPAEKAAAIAVALAVYLNNNRFVIKRIRPLDKVVMLFEKTKTKVSLPDAKHSFFTWRPKN